MPDYSTRKDSLVEQFIHPYKIMYVGFFWTHIRVMRPSSYLQAMNILKVDPNSYITYDEFKNILVTVSAEEDCSNLMDSNSNVVITPVLIGKISSSITDIEV